MSKKCVVLFSGGLDSRLAVKIMQEQGFEVLAVYFKLPFGCSFEDDVSEFVNENKCNLKIFDCTKGELLREYLECLRKPKHGRGVGINPCVDCKIFMLKKAREFSDNKKTELIVSGEVLGERPMSQMKKSIDLIEEKSGLKGRLLRPLSAKLLEEINAEREGLVDREKLFDIQGRKRDRQIELARKFKIKFPHPAGGCLLCEKFLKNRFKFLIGRGMNDYEIKLVGIGRHFLIDNLWVILGRDEKENNILEAIWDKVGELIVSEIPGPSAVIIPSPHPPAQWRASAPVKIKKKFREIVNELMKAYSKGGSLEDRKRFEKWRL